MLISAKSVLQQPNLSLSLSLSFSLSQGMSRFPRYGKRLFVKSLNRQRQREEKDFFNEQHLSIHA
jgi:hypothetical protein